MQARRLRREMTISHEEFFRLVPRALADIPFTRCGSRVEARCGERRIDIRLEPEFKRRLASLELPVTRISMALRGFGAEDEAAFLARFDLAFQKGGG